MAEPRIHRCAPGDHISKIAAEYGVTDWETLWKDNPELQKRRANPNLLVPGDEVKVPVERKQKKGSPTEQHHVFEAERKGLWLRVELLYPTWAPIAQASYALSVPGQTEPREGKTDDRGRLEEGAIPFDADLVELTVKVDGVPMNVALRIGALRPLLEEDPEKERIRGVQQRLENLGLDCSGSAGLLSDATRKAIREFRKIVGLQDSDKADNTLERRLQEIHEGLNANVQEFQTKLPSPPKREPFDVAPDFEQPRLVNRLVLRPAGPSRFRVVFNGSPDLSFEGSFALVGSDGLRREPAQVLKSNAPPYMAFEFAQVGETGTYTLIYKTPQGTRKLFKDVAGATLLSWRPSRLPLEGAKLTPLREEEPLEEDDVESDGHDGCILSD